MSNVYIIIERLRKYKANSLSDWGNPVRHGDAQLLMARLFPGSGYEAVLSGKPPTTEL